MTDNYLSLTNKLRRRFNEPDLDGTTWGTASGWDQFTKDAINYAYHDILNAEMEWPFLHQSTSANSAIKTTPGVQLYNFNSLTIPSGFTSPLEIKAFDWDTFYINSNETTTAITAESHVVSSTSPYSVPVTNLTTWRQDVQVTDNTGITIFTGVAGDPAANQYTVIAGTYYFNSAQAGQTVKISYQYATPSTQALPIVGKHLVYMDYDDWHEGLLSRDVLAFQTGAGTPDFVFKTQVQGQFGLTPIPDKIYRLIFEYWIDPLDLSATTDVPAIPSHFWQVIIEGATKYCHQFREDMQMSGMAEKRFMAGIARMRTELINRESDMTAGFYWYPHGRSYTLNTIR